MEFNQFGLTPIVFFNFFIWVFFTFAYLYQVVFMIRALIQGTVRLPEAKRNHSYAFVIAAHNEEAVIANLVERHPRRGAVRRRDRLGPQRPRPPRQELGARLRLRPHPQRLRRQVRGLRRL